jgi:hypothetical protein
MYHFCPTGTATAAGVGFVADRFVQKDTRTIRIVKALLGVMRKTWKLSRILSSLKSND